MMGSSILHSINFHESANCPPPALGLRIAFFNPRIVVCELFGGSHRAWPNRAAYVGIVPLGAGGRGAGGICLARAQKAGCPACAMARARLAIPVAGCFGHVDLRRMGLHRCAQYIGHQYCLDLCAFSGFTRSCRSFLAQRAAWCAAMAGGDFSIGWFGACGHQRAMGSACFSAICSR